MKLLKETDDMKQLQTLKGGYRKSCYLATFGAWPGCTFFIRAWIQFLRIPDVMADNV